MERAHGQLSTRFANRLSSNHTHGFAVVDQAATAQVAAVAHGAQTKACSASEGCANFDFVNRHGFKDFKHVFVKQGASRRQQFTRLRVQDFVGQSASQDAIAQGFNHFTAFNDGAHERAVGGEAIEFLDHQVLCHVDQTACQVTGVGCFQSRVGQAFARTVCGDEVLQHIQAFTEVGRNRCLNDRAIRLGHQTTHTRQLTNLRRRTAGARVGHHVNGVERFLLNFFAMTVNGFLFAQLVHHDLGHGVAGFAPDVNDLVVTLARSDQTRHILLFDVFHFFLGFRNDGALFWGNQHVVDANRDARACGQTETVLQQLVGKHHGLFQTALAERRVDELGNFFLLECFVDVLESQAFGQDFGQQGTAHCGVNHVG